MQPNRFRPSRFAVNSYRRHRAAASRATPYDRMPTSLVQYDILEQAQDEASHERSTTSFIDRPPPGFVFPPLWDALTIQAIYVSKLRKDPASFFILNFRRGVYAPATMEKLAFDRDYNTTLLDEMTPIAHGMTLFPVLELKVHVPKNQAARDELMEGWAIVTEVIAQVGSATMPAMKVLEMETEYPVFDEDE